LLLHGPRWPIDGLANDQLGWSEIIQHVPKNKQS